MILDALVRHYDRLAGDSESGIAPFGFSRQQVGFAIVLNKDGSLFGIEPRVDESSGKPRPVSMVVPHPGGKRTSAITPYFLWDKTAYVLGRDLSEEAKGEKKVERLVAQFEAFRSLHHQFALACDHPTLQAISTFLDQWNPRDHAALPDFDSISGKNAVFMIRNETQYAHEVDEIRDAWVDSLTNVDGKTFGRCLITNQVDYIAPTHPAIKGVRDPGGQAEKSIVSFNKDKPAFDSYGKQQGHNAPISFPSAFKYVTALNRLLDDGEHRVQLGDTTCVFWAESGDPDVADAVAEAFGVFSAGLKADDGRQTRSKLADFLARFRDGQDGADTAALQAANSAFYILGLAPNAARISVRFWHQSRVGEMAERLNDYTRSLAIDGLSKAPNLKYLVSQTARDDKALSPRIAGDLAYAVINGTPYPFAFASAILRRITAEGEVNPVRAAALKAFILRNGIAEMDYYYNPEHPSPAYHCGSILAALAFAQEQAIGKVNAGVVKKNMASVMSAPGAMLGRLQRAAVVGHLHKLTPDLAQLIEDELCRANCRLGDKPPKVLRMAEQTIFALGYYQQTARLQTIKAQLDKKHRHRSDQGEWMRSKLEVKVANAMARAGIVYIYEPSKLLLDAGLKYPDFVIRGASEADNVYIEVAGFPGEEYERRHQLKIEAYQREGISTEGGPNGRLVVLDYRGEGVDFDEMSVLSALSFLVKPNNQTPQTLSEEDSSDA